MSIPHTYLYTLTPPSSLYPHFKKLKNNFLRKTFFFFIFLKNVLNAFNYSQDISIRVFFLALEKSSGKVRKNGVQKFNFFNFLNHPFGHTQPPILTSLSIPNSWSYILNPWFNFSSDIGKYLNFQFFFEKTFSIFLLNDQSKFNSTSRLPLKQP
jgi:hypothetical protein